MFSRTAIALALTFTALLSACGPEKSTDELILDERDRQEKISRDRLQEQADRQLPNIKRWEGCYYGYFYHERETQKVLVHLTRWVRVVVPKDSVEPIEMPILQASLRSAKGDGRFFVGFNTFEANQDASFIRFVSQKADKAGIGVAELELMMNPSGNHEGYYRGPAMSQSSPINLEPAKASLCRVGS